MTGVTDPATELSEMIRVIMNIPQVDSQTGTCLARALGVDFSSTSYLLLLADIRTRIDRLSAFTQTLEDDGFDEHQRQQVLGALKRISILFYPNTQLVPFTNSVNSYVKQDDAIALSWFGPVVRRHHPLKKIENEAKNIALAKIHDLIIQIGSDDNIPEWARLSILESLERVHLRINHLPFFGHEAAIEALIILDKRTESISKLLGENTGKIWEVAKVITVCVSLFNAPATVHNSYAEYQRYLLEHMQHSQPPLALPKPSTSSPATD